MRFEVLGPLEASVHGTGVSIGARRHRQVLAALLVDAGAVVSADSLIERVWGEAGASPRSLQAIVSRLRSRLGEDLIATRYPGYVLDLTQHELDADIFTRGIANARSESDPETARATIRACLDLWKGPAYADIGLPFSDAEAQRLDRLRLSALDRLAQLDLELGRHGELLTWLPDLVAEHPLQESLRASLMMALYRSGRQADALAVFEDTRRVLADELGIDPTPELRQLHERVLRQDEDLAVTVVRPLAVTLPVRTVDQAARGEAPLEPSQGVLIGREQHLSHLTRVIEEGLQGGATFAVVSGEAGIGKTRLVEEAASRAQAATVVLGRCWDHEGTPAYWPWEQLITEVIESIGQDRARAAFTGRAEVAALLAPGALDAPPHVGGMGSAARVRLHDGVVAFLERASAHRPLVVVLEDFHWADDESVELLEFVAGSLRAARIAVLVTVREPNESARSAGREVLAVLARQPGVVHVELTGLTAPEVGELVQRRTGVSIDPAVADALHERTDGNPYYVSELALLYGEERRRSGTARIPVPRGLRAVIERRLRHLAKADLDVLIAAAVIGRSFDLGVLVEVTGVQRFELADVLDRAVLAGILDHRPGPTQRFTHALVQETLIVSVGPMRRAALHAAVASAIDARQSGEDSLAVAAYHYAQAGAAGHPDRGVELCLAAASSAEERLALAEAERNLRQALQLVEVLPADRAATRELEVRVRLGSVLTLRHGYNGDGVAAERRRVVELAASVGSVDDLLAGLWGTWGNALVSGRYDQADEAVAAIERAAAVTGAAPLELALHIARGQTVWSRGQVEAARRDLTEAVRWADAVGSELPLDIWLQHPAVAARGWLAVALAQLGRDEESDAMARRSHEVAQQIAHPFTSIYAQILDGMRATWLVRPEAALASGRDAMAEAERQGFMQHYAFALLPAGWGHGRLGDPEKGGSLLASAMEMFGALPDGHMFGHYMLGLLADVRLQEGRGDDALALVDWAIRESDRIGERFFRPQLHQLRARALRLLGECGADEATLAKEVAAEQGVLLREEFE